MTDTKVRPNIFDFASSELSHSAYWAWILDCLNYEGDEFAGPREVALGLLQQVGASDLSPPFLVEREVTLGPRSRVDICLTEKRQVDGRQTDGSRLFIENKVSDFGPWQEQVERYRQFLSETDRIAVVSAAFELGERGEGEGVCGYAGLEEIFRIEEIAADRHPLVGDHFAWVKDRLSRWISIGRKSCSSLKEDYEEALATSEGQSILMDFLTDGIAGHRHGGRNVGGTPWMQCRFAEDDGEAHDAIFYRIDRLKNGFYFAVRQYQQKPTEGKGERLMKLREWWRVAAEDSDLEWSSPGGPGNKESTIAMLFFDENPQDSVADELPRVHQKFLVKLREAGWEVWE